MKLLDLFKRQPRKPKYGTVKPVKVPPVRHTDTPADVIRRTGTGFDPAEIGLKEHNPGDKR